MCHTHLPVRLDVHSVIIGGANPRVILRISGTIARKDESATSDRRNSRFLPAVAQKSDTGKRLRKAAPPRRCKEKSWQVSQKTKLGVAWKAARRGAAASNSARSP